MTVRVPLLVLLLVLGAVLVACDGVGRAIVGPRELDAGSIDAGMRVLPCDPLRTVPPEQFVFDETRLIPPADCDEDGIPDEEDACPGVPDMTRSCTLQEHWCAAIAAGEGDLGGADLRGCTATVELQGDLSLRSAQLECARITFVSEAGHQVDLRGAFADRAILHARGSGSTTLVLSEARLVDAIVRVEGGAHVHAEAGLYEGGIIEIGPGASSGDGAAPPAVTFRNGLLDNMTIIEHGAGRPGRVRFENMVVTNSFVRTPVLDLLAGVMQTSTLDIDDLTGVEAELTTTALRTREAVLSDGRLEDVIVDRCESLDAISVDMMNVDLPGCVDAPVQLRHGRVHKSRIGAANVRGTAFFDCVFGHAESLELLRVTVEEARMCELGNVQIRESGLSGIDCEPDDIEMVCVDHSTKTRIWCPPIAAAPQCPMQGS